MAYRASCRNAFAFKSAFLPCWRYRFCSTISPSTFNNPVTYLRNGRNGAEIFLLGSCHVSSKSAQDVHQLIRIVKPSIVAIELCKERAGNLIKRKTGVVFRDFFKLPGDLRQKALTFGLMWLYELLRESGLEPGEEFRVAIQEGKQIGAEIAFIDEDIHVTMARIRRGMSLRAIFFFLANLNNFRSKIQKTLKMADEQNIDAYIRAGAWKETLVFLEIYFPDVIDALLYQRNALMVKRLREFEGKIVSVVGLAHVDGMQKLWEEAERSVDCC